MWDSIIFGPIDYSREPVTFLSLTHIITLIVCFSFIIVSLILLRKASKKTTMIVIRAVAIYITLMEIMKIIYHLHYGETSLVCIFPLNFCSLFIYASLIAAFGKGKFQEIGFAFLSSGAIIAGLAYLLIPSTDVRYYPIYHFRAFQSVSFHTLMPFVGLLVLNNGLYKPETKKIWQYVLFTLPLMIIALIINVAANDNLMFLMSPVESIMPVIGSIYNKYPYVYTIVSLVIQGVLPYFIGMIIYALMNLKRKDKGSS